MDVTFQKLNYILENLGRKNFALEKRLENYLLGLKLFAGMSILVLQGNRSTVFN